MELAQWKAAGSFEHWQGHDIFKVVHRSGDDKPWLLLIHGFPTSSFDFHQVWGSLGERYNLLAFDMLGFGYSDKPAKWEYSIMQQADIAEFLMKSEGVSQAAVLAHDVGDTVAQELLARFNTKQLSFHLPAMVLLNGGLFPETHRALAVQKLLLGPAGPVLSRLMSFKRFKASLRGVCSMGLSDRDIDDAWTLLKHNQGTRRMHQLIRYIPERIANRGRWVGALQKTDCALFLINGAEDPISGRHLADRFAELVPRGHVLRLGGLGHYPHLENAIRVLQPTIDFLDEEFSKARNRADALSA